MLLLAGCYDSRFEEPNADNAGPPPNTTLTELRSLHTGTTVAIEGDIVTSGVVTTSDRDENFYRTLCIEHNGAGIEVMAGIDHLHNDYPIGSRVVVRLKGLSVGISYGVLQAGCSPAPGSGFATDYIGGTKAALAAHLIRSGDAPARIEPVVRRIDSLTPVMCGTLVRIDALRYTPEDLAPGSWAGYKRFTDAAGRELFTYVRNYAGFAENEVPAGIVSLTGVLQRDDKGDGRYILKLRDERDCIY